MTEHRHTWKHTGHLDGCHHYTNAYVCTTCSATAGVSQERDPTADVFSMVWMTPDCDRCTELQEGAPVRYDLVVVSPGGEVEREEHTETPQQEEADV